MKSSNNRYPKDMQGYSAVYKLIRVLGILGVLPMVVILEMQPASVQGFTIRYTEDEC